nr:unnamed protein product [Digitaria exilis]
MDGDGGLAKDREEGDGARHGQGHGGVARWRGGTCRDGAVGCWAWRSRQAEKRTRPQAISR